LVTLVLTALLLGLAFVALLGLIVFLRTRTSESPTPNSVGAVDPNLSTTTQTDTVHSSIASSRVDPALANLFERAATPPGDRRDPEQLLARGLLIFVETGGVSTLVLQRRLHLDFAQATIIIDEMERRGYVSARTENKPRRLLPVAFDFARNQESE
jgi:DNA segregation ATPase FtsK/SpoIIIE-like protein